jgi:hypothetical protein
VKSQREWQQEREQFVESQREWKWEREQFVESQREPEQQSPPLIAARAGAMHHFLTNGHAKMNAGLESALLTNVVNTSLKSAKQQGTKASADDDNKKQKSSKHIVNTSLKSAKQQGAEASADDSRKRKNNSSQDPKSPKRHQMARLQECHDRHSNDEH